MKYLCIFVAFVWIYTGTSYSQASLIGSPRIQRSQNMQGKKDGMLRLNERTLRKMKKAERLQRIEVSYFLSIDAGLPKKYRFCRPWTRKFLYRLGRDFYRKFNQPITVSSAVRTVEYQRKLMRRNPNAAEKSSHAFGSTVDITKSGLNSEQLKWIRARLTRLKRRGLIIPLEEFSQPCFHIMVCRAYGKPKKTTNPG